FELEKENKRPKFFWWFSMSGVLITLLVGGYFLYPEIMGTDKHISDVTSSAASNGEAKQLQTKSPEKNISSPSEENNNSAQRSSGQITDNAENSGLKEDRVLSIEKNKPTAGNVTLVQIGSFRNKPNNSYFKNVPYKIVSKKGNNGLTRYYVVSGQSVDQMTEELKRLGINDIYIPEERIDLANASLVEVKNSEEQYKNTNAQVLVTLNKTARQNNPVKNTEVDVAKNSNPSVPPNTKDFGNNNGIIDSGTTTNSASSKTETNNGAINTGQASLIISKEDNKQDGKNSSDVNTLSLNTNTPAPSGNESTKQESRETVAKTDTIMPVVIKQDSVVKPEIKKDTSALVTLKPEAAIPTPLFTPQMAMMGEGGPNIQMPLNGASNEKFPITYSGNLKFQYRPFKLFSFSAGIGYSNYSVSKAETDFLFDKYLTSDYIFNTAAGPLNMSKENMLDGLFIQAPGLVFPAKYKYDAFINAINIPVEAQVNFLNTSRFTFHFSAGFNTTYILSQRSHLSVIKENVTNSVSYSEVKVNRLNYLLLFGLGCDVKLKNNLYLTLSPVYKYSLSSLSSGEINYKPNYISGQAGIKYIFKN
ncbi:MAG: hypothetical protein H0W61_05775, partial [Bacteroidetes bacterium]|nr:hypothetical protein [Bacteroidota bacterium]